MIEFNSSGENVTNLQVKERTEHWVEGMGRNFYSIFFIGKEIPSFKKPLFYLTCNSSHHF